MFQEIIFHVWYNNPMDFAGQTLYSHDGRPVQIIRGMTDTTVIHDGTTVYTGPDNAAAAYALNRICTGKFA
jgi:hypothetical protein